jgi:hypothetical protein
MSEQVHDNIDGLATNILLQADHMLRSVPDDAPVVDQFHNIERAVLILTAVHRLYYVESDDPEADTGPADPEEVNY